MHTSSPRPRASLPGGHEAQRVERCSPVTYPAAHHCNVNETQLCISVGSGGNGWTRRGRGKTAQCADAATSQDVAFSAVANRPGSHSSQMLAPSRGAIQPGGHTSHKARPPLRPNEPAGHRAHAVAATAAAKRPGGHVVHVVALGTTAKCPTAQGSQWLRSPALAKVPGEQERHVLMPASDENPAAHDRHAAADALPKRPAGQSCATHAHTHVRWHTRTGNITCWGACVPVRVCPCACASACADLALRRSRERGRPASRRAVPAVGGSGRVGDRARLAVQTQRRAPHRGETAFDAGRAGAETLPSTGVRHIATHEVRTVTQRAAVLLPDAEQPIRAGNRGSATTRWCWQTFPPHIAPRRWRWKCS